MMCIVLLILAQYCCILIEAQDSLNAERTKDFSIECKLSGLDKIPGWSGPPSLSTISFQDSPSISPTYQSRFSIDVDNSSLKISPVNSSDAGAYRCSHISFGDYDVNLVVIEPTIPPAPLPEPCCCRCLWGYCSDSIVICFLCWLPVILIALYIVGIIIGIIWKKTNCCCKCFYHCKGSDCCECCQCCGENTYVRCKFCASWPCGVFCNITQLPFWYQILWGTIIGIPVALGIYTIWRCCGRAENPGDSEQNKESKEMDGGVTKG